MTIFPELLKYGAPGLALGIAILAFWLLYREIQRDSVRGLVLVGIATFMFFSGCLAVLALIPQSTLADLVSPNRALKIEGKVLPPPDPTHVSVIATRKWVLTAPDGEGWVRGTIDDAAAPIKLEFQSGKYIYPHLVKEDQIKDRCYHLGEIRLKE
jgi:hypothetical protein